MTFTWTKHSPTAWAYDSDDLCACVWVEHDTVWWDVSGPKGRGTIASGCAPGEVFAAFLNTDQRMTIAKRLAEVYIAGFRRGEARPVIIDIDKNKRLCAHCKKPIRPGQLIWDVPGPDGQNHEVHASCMDQGAKK